MFGADQLLRPDPVSRPFAAVGIHEIADHGADQIGRIAGDDFNLETTPDAPNPPNDGDSKN